MRDAGTERLNWRDLYVLIRGWQKEPHNLVAVSVHGFSVWSVQEQLLAEVADRLAMANWQRAGNRSAPRPKRVPRPWENAKDTQRLGRDPIPVSQFDDWWDSATKKARTANG